MVKYIYLFTALPFNLLYHYFKEKIRKARVKTIQKEKCFDIDNG